MKTNLDIYLSASEAALKSLGLENRHGVDNAALAAFAAAAGEAADYDRWREHFDERRGFLAMLAGQKAPSGLVKDLAAKNAKNAKSQ